MDNIINFDKSNNEKRKMEFNKRLLNGDPDALRKFIGICTALDENDESLLTKKLEQAVSVVTSEFDLDTIKNLDCKLIPVELFGLIAFSAHIKNLYELGEYVNEEYGITVLPNLLELSDGSTIKILLIINELDEDESLDDDDE